MFCFVSFKSFLCILNLLMYSAACFIIFFLNEYLLIEVNG